jgi:cyanate lyase
MCSKLQRPLDMDPLIYKLYSILLVFDDGVTNYTQVA